MCPLPKSASAVFLRGGGNGGIFVHVLPFYRGGGAGPWIHPPLIHTFNCRIDVLHTVHLQSVSLWRAVQTSFVN